MMRPKFVSLLVVAGCAALLSGPRAPADTGPAGQKAPVESPAMQNPAAAKQLTPETLAAYLRTKNHKVEVTKASDGRPVLLVHIQQKGWHYDIEIEFTPNLGGFYLLCPLGKAGAQLPAAQAMELIKASHRYAPAYFSIRASDQRLCFEDFYGTQMTEAVFQSALNRYLGNIEASYSLWDSGRWPVGGGIMAGPAKGNPVP